MGEPVDERVGKLELGVMHLVENYAQHHPACCKVRARLRWNEPLVERVCDCGLDAAVAEIKDSINRTRAAIIEFQAGLSALFDDGK